MPSEITYTVECTCTPVECPPYGLVGFASAGCPIHCDAPKGVKLTVQPSHEAPGKFVDVVFATGPTPKPSCICQPGHPVAQCPRHGNAMLAALPPETTAPAYAQTDRIPGISTEIVFAMPKPCICQPGQRARGCQVYGEVAAHREAFDAQAPHAFSREHGASGPCVQRLTAQLKAKTEMLDKCRAAYDLQVEVNQDLAVQLAAKNAPDFARAEAQQARACRLADELSSTKRRLRLKRIECDELRDELARVRK